MLIYLIKLVIATGLLYAALKLLRIARRTTVFQGYLAFLLAVCIVGVVFGPIEASWFVGEKRLEGLFVGLMVMSLVYGTLFGGGILCLIMANVMVPRTFKELDVRNQVIIIILANTFAFFMILVLALFLIGDR